MIKRGKKEDKRGEGTTRKNSRPQSTLLVLKLFLSFRAMATDEENQRPHNTTESMDTVTPCGLPARQQLSQELKHGIICRADKD